jgi:hypothetical protein
VTHHCSNDGCSPSASPPRDRWTWWSTPSSCGIAIIPSGDTSHGKPGVASPPPPSSVGNWKRRIWLGRWFAAQAQLRQKRLRIRMLCRGSASAHAVSVRGHSTSPTPTDKPFDPKVARHPFRDCGSPQPLPQWRKRNRHRCRRRRRLCRRRGSGQRVLILAPDAVGEGSLCLPAELLVLGLHRMLWQLSSTVFMGKRVQNLPSRLPQQSNMLSASTRKFGRASCLRDYRRQHSTCTSMLLTPSCVSSDCACIFVCPCAYFGQWLESMLDGEGQETRFSSLHGISNLSFFRSSFSLYIVSFGWLLHGAVILCILCLVSFHWVSSTPFGQGNNFMIHL